MLKPRTRDLKTLRSKFLFYLGIVIEVEVAVKFIVLSDHPLKALPLVLLFLAVYVATAFIRKKRYIGPAMTLVSLLLFHLTAQNSGIAASDLHHVTFDTVFSITMTHCHPLITLIYGISMMILFLFHNPALAMGVMIVTGMLMGVIYFMNRTIEERDNFHKASITDSLTGLYSFSFALQTGQAMFAERKAVRVLLIDVDQFKQINDTYGHLTGNKVLVFVAGVLKQAAASLSGVVGRLGGDEFIIIVEECPEAVKLNQNIHRMLHEHCYRIEWDSEMKIYISVGEAVSTDQAYSEFQELLHAADMEMYLFKQRKNMTMLAGQDHELLPPKSAQLLDVLSEKDMYTHTHSLYVAQYAADFAGQLGLGADTIQQIRIAGWLHDIGKTMIPNRLLRKKGKLTAEEYDIVKQHVTDGLNLLSGLHLTHTTIEAIRHHHERWDGTGYPNGVPGSEQPIEARILQVADAFSAMTVKRIYRERVSVQEAANEIRRQAGRQFDPELAEQFVAMVVRLTEKNEAENRSP